MEKYGRSHRRNVNFNVTIINEVKRIETIFEKFGTAATCKYFCQVRHPHIRYLDQDEIKASRYTNNISET